MAAFRASARSLDQGVGEVLGSLETYGLSERTLIVFTTDHGIPFPGAKATLYDRGLGVMLIMRGPGGFSGGHVRDGLVSHIDIYPTLCELVGAERPSFLQGTSLMPLVRGEADEVNEAIFAGSTWHAAYEPQRAVRTSRWKYIRRFDDRVHPVLPNTDDGPSKDYLLRHGWGDRVVPPEQLYDLVFDPGESSNVAGEDWAGAALEEMRNRLEGWMTETDDPLRHGPVEPPSGVEVNDPDGLSAAEPTISIP
jgi:N-sulfoglucosamine sulfohydrolase